MTINIQEFTKLKDKADKLKSEVDKAQGAIEQSMRELKDKFECETIEEAEQLLEELEKQVALLTKNYDDSLVKFKEEWEEKLEEV